MTCRWWDRYSVGRRALEAVSQYLKEVGAVWVVDEGLPDVQGEHLRRARI